MSFCQGKQRVTVYDRTPIVAVPRPATSFEVLKCDILGPLPINPQEDMNTFWG